MGRAGRDSRPSEPVADRVTHLQIVAVVLLVAEVGLSHGRASGRVEVLLDIPQERAGVEDRRAADEDVEVVPRGLVDLPNRVNLGVGDPAEDVDDHLPWGEGRGVALAGVVLLRELVVLQLRQQRGQLGFVLEVNVVRLVARGDQTAEESVLMEQLASPEPLGAVR